MNDTTASDKTRELSVIVPAWNEESFLAGTLESIRASFDDLDVAYELIVVDNNSTDATASMAKAAGASVVFEPVNQIARARNAGARASTGKFLLFVDADTSVSTPLVAEVLRCLRSGEVVGGGASLVPDMKVPAPAMMGFRFWSWLSKTFGYAAGSCFWSRRDAFEAVGGFPEARYAGEELVLSKQLKRWGRKHDMSFHIIDSAPVVTSARKLVWYSPMDLLRQTAVILIPGAMNSRRMMHTWYDDSGRQALRNANEPEECADSATPSKQES